MSFTEYLQEVHAEDYMGNDDDMPDSFDDFLVELQPDEWITHAENWRKNYDNT